MTKLASKLIGLEHSVVVAIALSTMLFRLYIEFGSRFPALISDSCQSLAAIGNFTKSDLKEAFNKLKWAKPLSLGQWLNEVEEIKVRRFGIDESDLLVGVTAIAVPFVEDS